MHKLPVKGCRHTDRLGKDGRHTGAGHTVECFIPPIVLENP